MSGDPGSGKIHPGSVSSCNKSPDPGSAIHADKESVEKSSFLLIAGTLRNFLLRNEFSM